MKTNPLILSMFIASTLVLGACEKTDQTAKTTTPQATPNLGQAVGSIPEAALSQIELSYWEQGTGTSPSGTVPVKVGVSNNSDYPLEITNPPTYQAMATWHDPETYAAVGAPIYGPIAYSIPAKQRGFAEMKVLAPGTAGQYLLKIQIADGSGASLESKGVKPLLYTIEVK